MNDKKMVFESAKAKFERIREQGKADLGYDGMDNPVWCQYFKNGAWFGYRLAKKHEDMVTQCLRIELRQYAEEIDNLNKKLTKNEI